MSRSVAEIITDLSNFNPSATDTTHRLSHDCYMIVVGYLEGNNKLKILEDMIKAREEPISEGKGAAAASIGIMECEEVETILENITLKHSTEELNDARKEHFVYEDHFNLTLCEKMENSASFAKLETICRKYEAESEINVDTVMEELTDRADETYKYFLERGLSEDDARASAFAIAFYTGSRSEACSRGASLVARRANGVAVEQRTVDEMKEASIILYYLVKGLSNIPYYWGYVTRACQLKDHELALYTPGDLITWLQFSSSKRGKEVATGGFENRNTQFKIYSLTGRRIQFFSNYDHEDEVLFLPHSTFLVFKHVTSHHGEQHTIYMRQVELGLSTWSVLWVDNRIFVENWENKAHMEYAAAKALNMNVHFIPKSTTEYAISFLKSPFGQRLKNKNTFRIVTDMNRENERPVHNAGARLIKKLRQLGFQNQCLVFTSNKQEGDEIMKQEMTAQELQNTIVTVSTDDLRRFVNFQ